MKHRVQGGSLRQTEPCVALPLRCGGFTLIELMIVTVIVGLLAGLAIPQFNGVRERAYNAAALADLNNATKEIERYFNEHFSYPTGEDQLFAEGYSNSPGVSFTKFDIRDAGDPELARVHMHIEHEWSRHYYHYEYPKGGVPELRWKK